jgi:hypothetical protein
MAVGARLTASSWSRRTDAQVTTFWCGARFLGPWILWTGTAQKTIRMVMTTPRPTAPAAARACRDGGQQFPVRPLVNDSRVGRLLEEISWEGNTRPYRQGGRGRGNALTTEVFALPDWLPRQAFLGAVLAAAHGADAARTEAAPARWRQ